jgi:phosphoenolpyruvate carboxykinase (ATP)
MLGRNVLRSVVRPVQARAGMATITQDACKVSGISAIGITNPTTVHKNLSYDELRKHEIANNEGVVTSHKDCFMVDTGIFTGRSPKDKFIVKKAGTQSSENVWWGSVNQPMKAEVFDELMDEAIAHYNSQDKCYVFDGFVGAAPGSRRKIRFIHDLAWQQHFVTNMFIRPSEAEYNDISIPPDFTVINACALTNKKWQEHGLNSEVCVAIDVEKKTAVIMGTWYGGENKKLIFSLMNYWLPMEGTLPMHCSASVDMKGENAALFFGLSGTGKTTLSADPNRQLIGDDEHGWHDTDGIFNFEGGCYAKTIDLKIENEPDIWNAIKAPAALLENVAVDPKTGDVDYSNTTKTQNGRVSYPIFHIDNHEPTSRGGHPKNVIFLTADAFGVLPPVSKLSTEQALYHFITGYTAKVAGTERGVTEPEATFSACFGAAFLTMHPTKYADLLRQRLDTHGATAYLVNTGWAGGAYGVGKRMAIGATRSCITAILDGSIDKLSDSDFEIDPVFNFKVPKAINGVDASVPLLPRTAWEDKDAYDAQREKLALMFQDNFKKYTEGDVVDYSAFGPTLKK